MLGSGLLACGGSDGTAPRDPVRIPTSIELSPTALDLALGASERIVATVKDQTGAVLTTLPPGVSLSWSTSDVSRATVDATGLVQAVRPGAATVSAGVGAISASAAVTVRGEALPGSPGDPAATAIPREPFVARAEDYSLGHPALPGMYLSFNTLALTFVAGVTVAQANAILAALPAEIVGGIPEAGMVMLRLPVTTHAQMEAALASLRGNPVVHSAVQDALGTIAGLPAPGSGIPPGWQWDVTPAGGNYGLELIRAPQMWNLNAALRKPAAAPLTVVGIMDGGFIPTHVDLPPYRANLTPAGVTLPDTFVNHGTHVAGTIAARFDNGGVVGVTPFADLVVQPVAPPLTTGGAVVQALMSLSQANYQLRELITHSSRPRVINLSLQIRFCAVPVNPQQPQGPFIDSDTDLNAQALATNFGKAVSVLLASLDAQGYAPLLIAAAGNCAGKQARWESAYANAALVHGAPNIVVVESIANSAGGGTLSGFSNIGGDISAPGGGASDLILSTGLFSTYYPMAGTSMATPHVTGLAAFLWTVDPQLLPGQVRGLLLNQGNTVAVAGGAAPRIDAFSTVLDIDRVRGNDRVLKMLVDVDDGSVDGNRRLTDAGTPVTDEDIDLDGGIGDGTVDMSDFRRFRDWLLQAENPAGLALDGSATHTKKDLNGDGQYGTPFEENFYPRGDFNGDGFLHRTATTSVRGFSSPVTDLDVLRKLFFDPHHQASQLSGLLDSGDLTIDAGSCFPQPNADRVATSIRVKGTTQILEQRTHRAGSAQHVYSVAPNAAGYTARFELFDAANLSLLAVEQDFSIALGGDQYWTPDCSLVRVTINPTIASLTPGATRLFTATVTGASNTSVTWTATGGTVTAGGLYTAGQTLGTFEVRATSVSNPGQSATAQVTIAAAAAPRIAFISAPYGERSYWSWVGSSRYCNERDTNEGVPVPSSTSFPSADCVLPPEAPPGLVGRGSSGLQIALSDVATNLPTVVADLGASFNIVGDGSGSFAGGDAEMDFRFDVLGPVKITITGTLAAQASDNTQDSHRYALVRLYGRNDVFYAIAGRRFDTDPLSPSSVTVDFSVELPPGNYDLDIELVASGHDGGSASPHTRNGSARADITVRFSPP